MKRLLLALCLIALVTPVFVAQESVSLTTPIVKTATTCDLNTVSLYVKANRITAALDCNDGSTVTKQYDAFTVPTGATLLHSLNIGNFSVNSLIKAVYTRLISDGVIVGTVSGVPQ